MAGMCNYEGKVVIVTGARSGIGAATAKKFASLGAQVVCAGRRPCTDTIEAIKAAGGEAITIKCDVSVAEDVQNLVNKTVETYGKLDVLVNNAGSLPPTQDLVDQSVEDFDHTMAVDVKGVFLGMKYGIPEILKAGGGAVVNVCSVAGLVADPGMAPYVAAKHAVVGLTKAAGIEYAGKGVRVNGVAPGFVSTEMTQGWMDDPEMKALVSSYNWQNRIADPSEIASVVAFLASEEASFMGGAVVPVDAGQTAH